MSIKSIALSTLIFFMPCFSVAQKAHYFLIGANADLIKTDNDGFFKKAQGGLEANYYISRKFTGTTGVEWWMDEKLSWVLGARWYPIDDAFFRMRGLLGEQDIAIGGGWAKPLCANLRVEAMADIYFSGHISIRAGVAYAIRKSRQE